MQTSVIFKFKLSPTARSRAVTTDPAVRGAAKKGPPTEGTKKGKKREKGKRREKKRKKKENEKERKR